jgi:iron complex transport system substrate-binding protein
LPQVGYARSLSAEGILALGPTHVLVTEEAGPASVLRQIAYAGVTIEQMDSGYRFEGLVERITRIGKLLNRASTSSMLVQQLKLDWERLHLSPSALDTYRPRVLFLLAHSANRLLAAGTHTGAHAMIEYAGAINATMNFSGYKPLTPESLIAAQPDVLLLTEHGVRAIGDYSTLLKLPGMSETPAGRHRRFAAMDASLLLGFGPRLPAAVQSLKLQLIAS